MALRKKFTDIEIPLFKEKVSVLGDKEIILNKSIKLDISKKLKGKATEIIFFVRENNEGNFIAFPRKIIVLRNYIVKFLRNRTSYVEDSFDVQCKDVLSKVKFILITRRKVSRSLRKALRDKVKEIIIESFAEKKFVEICDLLIKEDIQKDIAHKIKKIYPPLFFEIRHFETKEKDKISY
ncbi:MAG: hypothetical protein QW103_01110 [Candidatus Pacearchaeota archaeon]